MSRNFYIILFSTFLFIGINTVFYFTIFRQQRDFQTELLTRQTRICGSTLEQEGLQFENELNSIPYQDDFTRLFTDEEIKQHGSQNLQKLYGGYSPLINKITVYDNQNNVYSLIMDRRGDFVSDYYESQQQTLLQERDELVETGDRFLLTIPGFDESGKVKSNILVDLNYTRFINEILERYALENILWYYLVSEDGRLISSSGTNLAVPGNDLNKIGSAIKSESEGSILQTIIIDSVSTQVVSAYYPVRLVKRNLGIVFSIKTDLFLKSILIKTILITFFSLLLLTLVLYIHSRELRKRQPGPGEPNIPKGSLVNTLDTLSMGMIFLDQEGKVRMINRAAREMLSTQEAEDFNDQIIPGFNRVIDYTDASAYQKAFGPGSIVRIDKEPNPRVLYKMELDSGTGSKHTKILLLIDISEFEMSRKLEQASHRARAEILEKMSQEIFVPLHHLSEVCTSKDRKKTLDPAELENLRESCSLVINLVQAAIDFAGRETVQAVTEKIPFYLGAEIDLALEPYRGKKSDLSLITKIRNDVPEKLLGDPFRLRKALAGLVESSIDLTEEGRILISAGMLEKHAGRIRLQFEVEDTGKGIPPDRITEIIRELERGDINLEKETDAFRKRLCMAKRHIELMKGSLHLESPSGISTDPQFPGMKYSFSIEVMSQESTRENLQFGGIRHLDEIKCLVLTDEKDTENQKFGPLLDVGIKLKYLIYRPENPESLYALVEEKAASTHVLIFTYSGSDKGLSLARELINREIARNCIVILLSSDPERDNLSLSRNSGIDYYLEEPCEPYPFIEILLKHFPDLDKEELKKVPELEKINPELSILLAEDNLFNRKVIQGLFKRLGLEIDLAENGVQALQMTRDKKYDLVFMDILMPEMGGLQAAAEIRRQGSDVPIIALTSLDERETRKMTLEGGFTDYLIKPASAERLRKVLLQYGSKSR